MSGVDSRCCMCMYACVWMLTWCLYVLCACDMLAYVHVCVSVCVCECVCVCVCERERERERERESTDNHTHVAGGFRRVGKATCQGATATCQGATAKN